MARIDREVEIMLDEMFAKQEGKYLNETQMDEFQPDDNMEVTEIETKNNHQNELTGTH